MLSLSNAFDDADVAEFDRSIRSYLGLDGGCAAEPTPPSRRSTGCRCRCATKTANWFRRRPAGMAAVGENVTANARTIADIPQGNPGCAGDILEVRGEVYMSHASISKRSMPACLPSTRPRRARAPNRPVSLPIPATLRPGRCANSIRRSPGRARCVFSPMPGESCRNRWPQTQMRAIERLSEFGFETNPLTALCAESPRRCWRSIDGSRRSAQRSAMTLTALSTRSTISPTRRGSVSGRQRPAGPSRINFPAELAWTRLEASTSRSDGQARSARSPGLPR